MNTTQLEAGNNIQRQIKDYQEKINDTNKLLEVVSPGDFIIKTVDCTRIREVTLISDIAHDALNRQYEYYIKQIKALQKEFDKL